MQTTKEGTNAADWTKMYFLNGKDAHKCSLLACHPAGVLRFVIRFKSLTRCQPVRAYRLEGSRWILQGRIITSLAQTPDGYLWVGTESGLLRFDGVRPVLWQPPSGQQLPGSLITTLLTAHDGTLWIATFSGLAEMERRRI